MAKKKQKKRSSSTKRKTTKKTSFSFKFFFIILFFIAILGGIVFLYKTLEKDIFNKQNNSHKENFVIRNELLKMKKLLQKEHEKVKSLEEKLQKYIVSSEAKDYEQNFKNEEKIVVKKKDVKGKPKLVIIIDDVAFFSQAKKIKSLKYHITPSIFPPTSSHPNTPKIAKTFPFFMVHLPTQTINSHFRAEPDTLNVTSSKQFIDQRIRQIKQWFPKLKYLNNHTGSKFTANFDAMVRLFNALDKYDLEFVDSRTTPKTKAKQVARLFGKHIYSRDIFLDNKQDISYIQNQLKKAVKIAKIRGYAIAIGHPHNATIEAIKRSKYLLKDVELVYLNEL